MGTHPLTHRLLSRESPSGMLKAVLRKVPGKEKEKEKQFLEVRRGLDIGYGYWKSIFSGAWGWNHTVSWNHPGISAPRSGIRTGR